MKRSLLLFTVLFLLGCSNDDDTAPDYPFTGDLRIPAWMVGTWGTRMEDGSYYPYFKIKENDICRIGPDKKELYCMTEELGFYEAKSELSVNTGGNAVTYSLNYYRNVAFSSWLQFNLQPDGTMIWYQGTPDNPWVLYKIE